MDIRTRQRSYRAFEGRTTCMNNEETLKAFERKMRLERLSEGTIQMYLKTARRITVSSKLELEQLLVDSTPAIHNTILATLRKMSGYGLFDSSILEDIKKVKIPTAIKSPDDLLTREELQKLLTACENSKERAFLACLFDSQCRLGELLMIDYRDVTKISGKYKIAVRKTKTGVMGTKYIYEFQAYLRRFIEDRGKWAGLFWFYPSENIEYKTVDVKTLTPKEFHDIKEKMRGIFRNWFDKVKERAGLSKKQGYHKTIHFKLYRASGSVDKLRKGIPYQTVKKHGSWKKDSPVFDKSYLWLSEEDVESDFDHAYGIIEKIKKVKPLTVCPVCQEPNSELQERCSRCGNVLTFDYTESDELKELIMENESVREAIIKIIMQYKKDKEKEKENE